MGATWQFATPLREADVRKLQVGDLVFLDGQIVGVRDATLIRIFDHGVKPPIDLSGAVLLHTAPNVRREGDWYTPLSVGTTTSARMDRFTRGLLKDYGVRAIVGKGGLYLSESLEALKTWGGCYLAVVGGAAAWQTLHIEAIEAVYWEDLIPEALWVFRVRSLGPLFVAIDSYGRNLYAEVSAEARALLKQVLGGEP